MQRKWITAGATAWLVVFVLQSACAQEPPNESIRQERLTVLECVRSESAPPIHLAYYTRPTGLEMMGPADLSHDGGRIWEPFTPPPDFSAGLPCGYALRCKADFAGPFVWVAGYCDDVFAYLPSRCVLLEGGYEGRDGIIHQLTATPFLPNVEQRVLETLISLVRATSGK